MSWGPLRFVDSMNVFPTSLASMIDDLRARKQLPELFPLMASLHPELQLRTPTLRPKDGLSNSGGRTATWSRRGTASCASCPCPSSTSAAPRRGRCSRCGSSTAEDHRLAVNTANLTGWETFREFHDCYLHTDILALTDVMESYRDSFRAQSGLDPILCHAARSRLGRHATALNPQHSHSPHHQRAGLRPELHLPALRSSQQPRAGRGGLQL